jgi:hypothetical protein
VLPSGSSAPLRERHERFSERASADDYGSQVRAMSTILGRLADQIAAGAK